MCYFNLQTQLCRFNILALYSVLLHVSAVYITHYHVGIGSQKEFKKGERAEIYSGTE